MITGAEVSIRTARTGDAPHLVAIRSCRAGAPADESVHHLGIPSGDDYFCLAGEIGRVVVGYLSAGGSRDDDRKSYGEFYELVVDPGYACSSALRDLAEEGLVRLMRARYGGVIAWVDRDDSLLGATLTAIGLAPDERSAGHRARERRFTVEFPPEHNAL